MRIVITGGTGFIGLKLAADLLRRGELEIEGRSEEISSVVLFDRAETVLPPALDDKRVALVRGDITDRAQVEAAIGRETATVFHLAAVVSAEAEADLDLGLAVNLDGTRHVLDACRRLKRPPRLIFASSAAVYGGEPPLHVTDATRPAPRTSYGAEKLCGEILVADYTRKGLVDGRSLRLPTIVVRPGGPNRAASTFVSSIVREPLSGREAVCPVSPVSRMAVLSPRRLVHSLAAVHNLDGTALGAERVIVLPALSASLGEMVEGVRRSAGETAAARVRWEPDAFIQRIVDGWPASMTSERAERLGLSADASVDAIIEAFIEDDLPASAVH